MREIHHTRQEELSSSYPLQQLSCWSLGPVLQVLVLILILILIILILKISTFFELCYGNRHEELFRKIIIHHCQQQYGLFCGYFVLQRTPASLRKHENNNKPGRGSEVVWVDQRFFSPPPASFKRCRERGRLLYWEVTVLYLNFPQAK